MSVENNRDIPQEGRNQSAKNSISLINFYFFSWMVLYRLLNLLGVHNLSLLPLTIKHK